MRRAPFLPLVLGLLLASTGCALFPSNPDAVGNARRGTAGRHMELAADEIERAEYGRALERLLDVRDVEGLVPEDRDRCEALLERCAELSLRRLEEPGFDSGDLMALYDLDLPPRLKALAGTRAAGRMLAEGRRVRAVKTIRKVERELPSHPERGYAGDVLARAGLSLARDDGRYNLIFRYRSRGVEALEYLVLNYPFDPHCAEAYATLARIYEDRGDLDDAISRYEDLLVYHSTSPFAVEAQARLAKARMERTERDDYDRGDLLRAEQELEDWLQRHAGHELEDDVEETLRRCRTRLAAGDLGLARYYRRIDEPFGARMHAERALQYAMEAESEEHREAAEGLLANLPAPVGERP